MKMKKKGAKVTAVAVMTASAATMPGLALGSQSAYATSLRTLTLKSLVEPSSPIAQSCGKKSPIRSDSTTGTKTNPKGSVVLTDDSTSQALTKSLTPSAVTTAADGSVHYSYQDPDGESLNYVVPPAGFDPLTATDAQLAEYNFPSRPTSATGLEQWNAEMASYQGVPAPDFQYQTGSTATSEDASATTPSVRSDATDQTTDLTTENWAGWADGTGDATNGHDVQSYRAVKATFVQPTMGDTSCLDPVFGSWVGLGSLYNDQETLIQDGSVPGGDAPESGCGSADPNCAWYEWVGPAGSIQIATFDPNLIIKPGDSVTPSVEITSDNPGTPDQTVLFTVMDDTSGEMASFSTTVNLGTDTGLTSAEYITEKIGAEGSPSLENYGSYQWSSAYAYDQSGNDYAIQSGPNPTKITMENIFGTGDVLAYAGNLDSSGSGFTSTWANCN